MEDKGTTDSPDLPVHGARAVETVVFACIVLGGGRVLFGAGLVVEKSFVRRGEKPDSEEKGMCSTIYLAKEYPFGRLSGSTRGTYVGAFWLWAKWRE